MHYKIPDYKVTCRLKDSAGEYFNVTVIVSADNLLHAQEKANEMVLQEFGCEPQFVSIENNHSLIEF